MERTQPYRPRSRRRKTRLAPFVLVLILLIGVCLVASGLVWGVREVPRLAEQRFGPPAPTLTPYQRVVYSARLLGTRQDLLLPAGQTGTEVPFTIEMGENVPSIAARLQEQGLIRDSDDFRLFLIYSGLDTGLQAGEYRLSGALNAIQIAQAMQDATPTEVSFNILPGWRIEEIVATLPTSGLNISDRDFLDAVASPADYDLPLSSNGQVDLEGFLMPGVYRLRRDLSASEVVAIFLSRFEEEVDSDLRIALERQGLALFEAVTLASIVQREAVVAEEQPMIASVFLNRLSAGMKLDSDPTVQYALGYNSDQETWWTNPLSSADLAVDSPYNTYLYPGLPPGPISSPSISAIRAVAFPAQTPYLYFRARCDGSGKHSFARSYEEHLDNACQ